MVQDGDHPSRPELAAIQGANYHRTFDYRAASPHLKWPRLFDSLSGLVRDALATAARRGLPLTVLEIGAGHGGFTEVLLAAGAQVTATEMSADSAERLRDRFALNDRCRVVSDVDGSLRGLDAERFSMILYASVIHHIPKYLRAVAEAATRHLLPGGALVTLQDPLWYPGVPRSHRLAGRAGYLTWRASQGDYRRAVATASRRARGVFDEGNPSDVVEYHVVRSGVDQNALVALLRPGFEQVDLMPYWSVQSGPWQRIGERTGMKNTFAIIAQGRNVRLLDG